MRSVIDVVIPAFNEEQSIKKVIGDIPKDWVRHIVVCNNRSTDSTKDMAEEAGAIVIDENRPGYGSACLAGIEYVKRLAPPPDIIVFMDGDYSDYPNQLPRVVRPILEEEFDMVIGSRVKGKVIKGSLTAAQVFGNWLATSLIKLFYQYSFSDLGPFRAITLNALEALKMEDTDYGWTVEMQVKAAKQGMKCVEVPVDYRPRIGKSKVSGTIKGTILAGHKILWTIFKYI